MGSISIITITLLHKKELCIDETLNFMMLSPKLVAIPGRGTIYAVMASTSFSKVYLLTPKLKTQRC